MVNALFVLIVFLLQLNKDHIHVKWPLGVKTNITYDETTQEVTHRDATTHGHSAVAIGDVLVLVSLQVQIINYLLCFFFLSFVRWTAKRKNYTLKNS